jgi:hypothetical protein
MSKRIARRWKSRAGKKGPRSRTKPLVIICSLVALALAMGVLAQWKFLPGTLKPLAPAPNPQGNFNANSPSKEYIYAGGRLIATEEPAGPTSSAPTNLVATTRDGAAVIDVTWSPVQGAQYYRVERSLSKDGPYTAISTNSTQSSLVDTPPSQAVTAYLYKVCVADNQGNCLSAYSNIDLATAVAFSDDPLLDPATSSGTTLQALHITQLRAAIDAVRVTAGLGAANWSQTPAVASNQLIYASHIIEMRARLDEARAMLSSCCGVSLPGGYTDPNLVGGGIYTIKRAHIKDLRDRVK